MEETNHSIPWYYRPLGIALLTLLVLGPLTLPLVWRSPALGPRSKWTATALILGFSAILAWQVVIATRFALQQLQPP